MGTGIHITILTYGSRGDIQPFMVLGVELMRSGRPSMAVPFFGNQPFWGDRIAMLGVGVRAVPGLQLSIDTLSESISALVNRSGFQG